MVVITDYYSCDRGSVGERSIAEGVAEVLYKAGFEVQIVSCV
jgi:hypothetical protein